MTETWREIPGFNGLYQASDAGGIRSGNRILKQHKATGGYLAVNLKQPNGERKNHRVHRLVALAFYGEPPARKAVGLETTVAVAHANGTRDDNRPENLRWASTKENATDRTRHRTGNYADKHPNSKLTAEQVREIRARFDAGEHQRSIAPDYPVSYTTICGVASRRTWKMLD